MIPFDIKTLLKHEETLISELFAKRKKLHFRPTIARDGAQFGNRKRYKNQRQKIGVDSVDEDEFSVADCLNPGRAKRVKPRVSHSRQQ